MLKLKEEQNKILAILKTNADSGGDGMTLNDLEHLGIPPAELRYYIDGLSEKGYVNSRMYMGEPSQHYITSSGVGYLLEKGDNE